MALNESTKPKTYQKADAVIFMETAQALGLSETRLSEELGYTENAGREWINKGQMPKVAALACEALRRRVGAKADTFTMVAQIVNGQLINARMVQNVSTAEIAGQHYLLIPVKKGT